MTCNCTLHPRKGHTDPCRACHSKHVPASRSADETARGDARVGSRRLIEGPATRREDSATAGPSPSLMANGTRPAPKGQTSEPHRATGLRVNAAT